MSRVITLQVTFPANGIVVVSLPRSLVVPATAGALPQRPVLAAEPRLKSSKIGQAPPVIVRGDQMDRELYRLFSGCRYGLRPLGATELRARLKWVKAEREKGRMGGWDPPGLSPANLYGLMVSLLYEEEQVIEREIRTVPAPTWEKYARDARNLSYAGDEEAKRWWDNDSCTRESFLLQAASLPAKAAGAA